MYIHRIPKALLHQVPTTLLHSLEGITDLDWEKLLKFQFDDGSFLFSPSSTAFAHMQTKNDKCLDYLTKIVNKFNGGGTDLAFYFYLALQISCLVKSFLLL